MSSKGEQTRARILDRALALAKAEGLEQITIGLLAEALAMSKSGVFAHFGSKEELQRAVLEEEEARFTAAVYRPALAAPRGLRRLQKLFELWLNWGGCRCQDCQCIPCTCARCRGGCLMVAASSEFDDKPGVIRDQLCELMQRLRAGLHRLIEEAVQLGELNADTDPALLAFQMHALVLAVHHDLRLLGNANAADFANRSFHALIRAAQAPSPAPVPGPRPGHAGAVAVSTPTRP